MKSKSANNPLLFIFLIAIVVFAQTITYDFAYDDYYQIVYNSTVQDKGLSLNSLVAPFTRPTFPGDLYRPLTVLSYRLTALMFGSNPVIEHSINIVLHALVCVALYQLLINIGLAINIALACATIFAVHPIHTEAVANISGRAELLAAIFCLYSLLSYKKSTGRCLVFAGLAFLAKESAMALTLIFPIHIFLTKERKYDISATIGMIAVAMLAVIFRLLVLGDNLLVRPSPNIYYSENPLLSLPLSQRILPALSILGKYIFNVVAPVQLSADYSIPANLFWQMLGSEKGFTYITIFVIYLALVLYAKDGRKKYFGIWSLASFILTANIFFPIGTIMGDRLCYLPSIGFIVLFTLYIFEILSSPKIRQLILYLTISLLTIATFTRSQIWKDNLSLFSNTVIDNPLSPKAALNLGMELYHRTQDPRSAKSWFIKALDLEPDNLMAARYLVDIAIGEGQLFWAKAIASKMLEQDPDNEFANNRLRELEIAIRELGNHNKPNNSK